MNRKATDGKKRAKFVKKSRSASNEYKYLYTKK